VVQGRRRRRSARLLLYLVVLAASAVAALTALAPAYVLEWGGQTSLPDWARWGLAGLALGGVTSLGLAIVLGPAARRLAGERYPLTEEERRELSVTERIEAVNATRQTLLQSVTGLVVIGGVVFTALGLLYTARTLETAQQGQITDRYTRAVEQLGNRQSLDVRLGGIYALERLANDSPRDRRTIYDVLAAFAREHDPAPKIKISEAPAADVQATLTVIGRRSPDGESLDLTALRAPYANLREAELSGVDLHGAALSNAMLSGAQLHSAVLTGADLRDADLSGAHLRVAALNEAKLTGVDLGFADLRDAIVGGADLRKAYLRGADLRQTGLPGADLRGADLNPADLRGAILDGANLAGVFLGNADLRYATLRQADLHDADFGVFNDHAKVSGADLREANLTNADLTGADLTRTDLTGVDLTGADLRGADLRGAGLNGVKGMTPAQIKAVAKTDAKTLF
jgi:uncharacterized protein YjbI with pentapeptide repeats